MTWNPKVETLEHYIYTKMIEINGIKPAGYDEPLWVKELEKIVADKKLRLKLEHFIYTRIIETIFANMPGDFHAEFCKARGEQFKPCIVCVKQQLREEWL